MIDLQSFWEKYHYYSKNSHSNSALVRIFGCLQTCCCKTDTKKIIFEIKRKFLVVLQKCSETARSVLELINPDDIHDLEEFADALANELFLDTQETATLENQIWCLGRQESVTRARERITADLGMYRRMCRRHHRTSAFGTQRINELLLQAVPKLVADRVLDYSHIKDMEFNKLARECLLQEGRLKTRNGGVLPEPRDTVYAVTGDKEAQLCGGCGEKHKRMDCPHRKTVCRNCHQRGHSAKVCKKQMINDARGRPAVILDSRRGTVEATIPTPGTQLEELESV
eukprot:GHVP01026623.1.p2 GENE.GHVP01026623.1~~GHVP01026623.1.p2  ORF type:complete len:284 (-),score=36.18 GHVP01026623.1:89-940(-)